MAASSISSGMLFTKPANMNTDRPAPNPVYNTAMPTGLVKCSVSAIFTVGNMTIWNGMTMENTNK